ncbi:hypothetical protein AB0E77_22550 [Streptomyces sp. NPDC032940]|uniref:hypothetical protein n=1 Tax=Streptomyces sp. NPDC032940 TaxID=3155366 RepID=UPI0033C2A1EF
MAAQAVAAAASGAASTAAADLVRDRLSSSDSGRAALADVDAAPDDEQAVRSVEEVVAENIAGDAQFAARLSMLLRTSSQQNVASVVVNGGKVSRSQIALGPLTINNTRSGWLALALGALLTVLIVVLAVHGGAQLVQGDDAPPDGTPSATGASGSTKPTAASALPPTTETVRLILPDRNSVDDRVYPQADTPVIRTSAAGIHICRTAPVCQNDATAAGFVSYGPRETADSNPGNHAEFLVLAFPESATAHLAYVDLVNSMEEHGPGQERTVAGLGNYGEESQGFAMDSGPTASMFDRTVVFRHGAFIGIAHQLDDGTPERAGRLRQLAGTLADRIATANAGRIP